MATMQAQNRSVKALSLGYPGTAKTGSLAALANSGRYKLRIVDLDGNAAPLYEYIDPKFYENVDIVTIQEDLKLVGNAIRTKGPPVVFKKTMDLLTQWRYTEGDQETDLGSLYDWGTDTVLVLDSLTALGKAAMRRVLMLQNRLDSGPRQKDWGLAQTDQEAVCEILTSGAINCHVIVTAHLKLIGPPEVEASDDPDVKEGKKKVGNIIPYRYYPSALGKALPPEIGKHFPFIMLYQSKMVGGKVKRQVVTMPREDVDVKVPLASIPDTLPVDSALLTLFDAVEGKK